MSRSSKLGAVLYNTESAWGENVTSFGTRLQTIGPIDPSGLTQEKLDPDRLVQLRNEITPGVNGLFGGEFETKFYLHGQGSTCAGSITLCALATLLGIVIGNAAAAGTNTTATGTGTATAPGVNAATGGVAGALLRVGAIGDAAGGGQFAVLSSHAASVMTLLTALAGTPANGAVFYNPANIYPTENPTGVHSITGTRWLFQTANQEYECHGCYPKSVTFSGTGPAEEPMVTIKWGVSWWRPVASPTMPSATTVQVFAHTKNACGSVFVQTLATATRATVAVRSFTFTIELGIVEVRGHGGVNQYQAVVGCTRTPDKISGEFVLDAEDATATPTLAATWDANTVQHLLYTASAADGSSWAIYFPYIRPDGAKPTQKDLDGLNRVPFKFLAGADNTKSTDLTRSAYRIALA